MDTLRTPVDFAGLARRLADNWSAIEFLTAPTPLDRTALRVAITGSLAATSHTMHLAEQFGPGAYISEVSGNVPILVARVESEADAAAIRPTLRSSRSWGWIVVVAPADLWRMDGMTGYQSPAVLGLAGCFTRLDRIAELDDGWYGSRSVAPHPDLIENVRHALRGLTTGSTAITLVLRQAPTAGSRWSGCVTAGRTTRASTRTAACPRSPRSTTGRSRCRSSLLLHSTPHSWPTSSVAVSFPSHRSAMTTSTLRDRMDRLAQVAAEPSEVDGCLPSELAFRSVCDALPQFAEIAPDHLPAIFGEAGGICLEWVDDTNRCITTCTVNQDGSVDLYHLNVTAPGPATTVDLPRFDLEAVGAFLSEHLPKTFAR